MLHRSGGNRARGVVSILLGLLLAVLAWTPVYAGAPTGRAVMTGLGVLGLLVGVAMLLDPSSRGGFAVRLGLFGALASFGVWAFLTAVAQGKWQAALWGALFVVIGGVAIAGAFMLRRQGGRNR